MKSLQRLVRAITIFGCLNIVGGAVVLFALIMTRLIELTPKSLLITILALAAGVLYLVTAIGLSKRKKWAWYAGMTVFCYSAICNFIAGFMVSIVAGIIALVFIRALLKERKAIFE